MNPSFWSNTIWFVLLGIITIIELVLIFIKAENRRLVLGLYLSVSGAAFSLEMAICAYLKAYAYFPMILPQSPPDDSIAGNLFSQFSIIATAFVIAVFNLRSYWIVIFAVAYGLIEELFIGLGIYSQNWYWTWMTVIGLLPLFWMVKKIYQKSLNHIGPFLRYLYIFFGLLTLHEHTIVWAQRLIGIRVLSENFLPEKEQSLVVLAAINFLLLAVTIMILYFSNIKWRWKAPVIAILYVAYYIAAKYDLVLFKEGWFFISTSLCIWAMYFYTFILDRLYGKAQIRLKTGE